LDLRWQFIQKVLLKASKMVTKWASTKWTLLVPFIVMCGLMQELHLVVGRLLVELIGLGLQVVVFWKWSCCCVFSGFVGSKDQGS
jgi:hypothetical protein